MSDADNLLKTAASTLEELVATLRSVHVRAFPCREYATVYFRGSEPVGLEVDGRDYDIRPSKRGQVVSTLTSFVELTRITPVDSPDPAA